LKASLPAQCLVLTLAFQIAVGLVLPGQWWRFGLFATVLLLTALGLSQPLSRLARSLWILPFTLCAFPMLFTTPGQPVFQVMGWSMTDSGLEKFFSLQLRAVLSLAASILLLHHLSPTGLLAGLRDLRFPWLFTAMVSMMLRYVDLLRHEFKRMSVAQAARSASARPPSWWWRAGSAGHVAGSLMLRSQHRAQRVHCAMMSRGYNGGPPPSQTQEPRSFRFIPVTGVALLLLGLSRWP